MSARRYAEVDVFTDRVCRGNPLAVVLDGAGLDDAAMQRFARWTNLSETSFLFTPTDPAADYRVRIWTPGGELPFAGHPTLGSCHAWLAAGGEPHDREEVVQQCGVGLVRVRRDGARLAFRAPPLEREPVEPATLARVLPALGLAPQAVRHAAWLDNGPRWLGLVLADAATVLALEPDHAALKAAGVKVGVVGPRPAGDECAFEVRAFAAAIGIAEDPVTGSLNASLAQWLIGAGLAPPRYVAAQGTRLGRDGRVHVEQRDGEVWVGGASVGCVEGTVRL
ncbi:MAG TPA: PhzF family phenazine biosynthesis protein [Ideonella sp.]|nr:PhzF family phenazine biosynthesis protein [Ideonella sp.]